MTNKIVLYKVIIVLSFNCVKQGHGRTPENIRRTNGNGRIPVLSHIFNQVVKPYI